MPSWVWIIAIIQFLLTIIIGLIGWNYRMMVGKVLEAIAEVKRDVKEEQTKHQENRERIIRLESGRMNGIQGGERLAKIDQQFIEGYTRLDRHHEEIVKLATLLNLLNEASRKEHP